MKLALKSAFVALAMLSLPTVAEAANALVTTNLNLRTGPGTKYQTIGSIPNGSLVDVRGCTSGYGWCQVGYAGRYGWASSRYLAIREGSAGNYSGNNFGSTAATIGIPLIAGVIIGSSFNNNDHWDRPHYRPHRPHRPNRPGWGNGHRPSRPTPSVPSRPSRPSPSEPSRPGWGTPSQPSQATRPNRPSRPSHSQQVVKPPRGSHW